MMAKPKSLWQKIWYFIWEDDSALSWIVNIVIAFVLIKFVIYPGLGFVMGTTHPVVAVVSGSMEHRTVPGCIEYTRDGYNRCLEYSQSSYKICDKSYPEKQTVTPDFFWDACGDFYQNYGIAQEDFADFPFSRGFNTGDIIVLIGSKPENVEVGDVIVFAANQPDPIIHRVIFTWTEDGKTHYTTKGDHNPTTLSFEKEISEDRLIGKAVFRIPWLGYIKIWFVEFLRIVGLGTTVGRLF
jgi:signal peptidase I